VQRIVRDKGKDSKDKKTKGPYTVQSSCEWEAIAYRIQIICNCGRAPPSENRGATFYSVEYSIARIYSLHLSLLSLAKFRPPAVSHYYYVKPPIFSLQAIAVQTAPYTHLYGALRIEIVPRNGSGLLNSCPTPDVDSCPGKLPVTPDHSDSCRYVHHEHT
jgi:hypothetical protein